MKSGGRINYIQTSFYSLFYLSWPAPDTTLVAYAKQYFFVFSLWLFYHVGPLVIHFSPRPQYCICTYILPFARTYWSLETRQQLQSVTLPASPRPVREACMQLRRLPHSSGIAGRAQRLRVHNYVSVLKNEKSPVWVHLEGSLRWPFNYVEQMKQHQLLLYFMWRGVTLYIIMCIPVQYTTVYIGLL